MPTVLLAPRQFKIVIYQFLSSLLLLFSLLMLIPTVISFINWSPKAILIGSLFTVPPLILSIVTLYVTQKHISRVVIDAEHSTLVIKKKGREDVAHDLKKISKLVLKELVYPMPGFKQFKITAEKVDGNSTTLFSDEIVLSGHRWNRFCKKLATQTDKPLEKESLIENLNGKLGGQ